MGRSVSTPRDAVVVAFNDHECEECFEFDDLKDCFVETCKSLWPSLYEDDRWLGREDHGLLSNGLVHVGLSEYCGVVAYWVAIRGDIDHEALAHRWAAQIEPVFERTFGRYRKIGTMSNGEAVYRAA